MENYELAVVAKKDLKEEVKHWVEEREGEVLDIEDWGKRNLAYKIKGETEGYYFFVKIKLPQEKVPQLRDDLRVKKDVLRVLVTKV